MAGTKEGGKKAAQANLAKNPNFYREIGAKGGKNGHTGGYHVNRELARISGRKGGSLSKRSSGDGSKRALTVGEIVDAHNQFLEDRKRIDGQRTD